MGIFLALLMLLTIASLLMNLSGNAEIGKLRQQNTKMREQLDQLHREYIKLLEQMKVMQEAEASLTPTTLLPGTTIATGPPGQAAATRMATTQVSLETMSENDRLEMVKSNAYRLQSILESYFMGHQGSYPASLEELDRYASANFANEVVTNPFSGSQAYITDRKMCLDITTVPADEGIPENAGKLLFQANPDDDGTVSDYTIAAFDGDGLLIRNDDGNIFTVSKP